MRLLVVLLASMFAFAAHAATIAGTVREAGTRRPIPGATVVVRGTDLEAETDDAGAFAITFGDDEDRDAPRNDVNVILEVSTSGFDPALQRITIHANGSASTDIYLRASDDEN